MPKRRKHKLLEHLKKLADMKRRLREEREAGGEIDPAAMAASASTSGGPSALGDKSSSNVEGHASDEEVLEIRIKEEVGEAIPVEFLSSTSTLEMPIDAAPPQFNISVAPTNVGTQEAAYTISINEIQDPLQGTSSIINPSDLQSETDLLRPAGFVTVTGNNLPMKRPTWSKINNGTKRKKAKTAEQKPVEVKKNPPRQAKTMTNAQELMNRKLTEIISTQNKVMKILKEMPEQGEGAARTSNFGKEDRFDICGRHIASLLRELPTFDALALESKLMDIVYKEREKLETFRRSLQGYSAILPSNNPA